MQEAFTLIAYIVFGSFIIYLLTRLFSMQRDITEGLTTLSGTTASAQGGGLGSGAKAYAENLKAKVVQLQDEVLMSKYKKEYEEIILHMDDYVNLLMIKETMAAMNGNIADMTASFQTLNLLNGVKGALNNVMKAVDAQ